MSSMAKKQIKKVVKKAVTDAPTKPRTVSVGKPAPPPVITVHGIDFEQGEALTFGKCVSTAQVGRPNARVYNFMKIADSDWYLLWSFSPQDQYLDYYSSREAQFLAGYTIVDINTPIVPPGPRDNAPNDLAVGMNEW
jgi:hypothetical protein